ncbi:MAG TPA: hypothetical protein VH300_05330 [Thermoleophilaceae bacterium]|nr:hypothetical protein [Thermoleophilaceae bacterium]
MNSNEQSIRRVAAIAIAIVGVIHLLLAPQQVDAKAYVGVLFIVGGLAALYVAVRLWMAPDRFAWTLGAVVSACMFVGFILSRTTGLPGFKEEEWELSGIVTLILEAGFIAAWIAALRARPAAAVGRRNSHARATTGMQHGSSATLRR